MVAAVVTALEAAGVPNEKPKNFNVFSIFRKQRNNKNKLIVKMKKIVELLSSTMRLI